MFAKVVKRRQQTLGAPAPPDSLAAAVTQPAITQPAITQPATTQSAPATLEDKPLASLEPTVAPAGWWPHARELAGFLAGTEVHTYAFSVAANVIFSLFPFIVLIITIVEKFFPSDKMAEAIRDMLTALLPVGGAYVYRNMAILVHPHRATQLFSVFMLLVTSTGVFLPLEVALNEVWGVKKHRNYLENQVVSLGLAAAVGILVLSSVAMTAGQKTLMGWVFFGHTDNFVFHFLARFVLEVFAIVAGILMFFLIYWILPHRKIPAMAVLPTSIVVGLTWEVAKYLYVLALPKLDFNAVYGPFSTAVALMMWAFLSGLILLAGAHFSATQYTLRLAREARPDA